MTAINHPIVIFSAALGLLVLTETAGNAAVNVENHFSGSPYAVIRVPSRVEVRRASDGTAVLVRTGLPSSDEQDVDVYPPFTCAQKQVIDEVELTGEEALSADCD
jgi:hypothetical protein